MATAETKAVKVHSDSVTFGQKIYNKGDVILNASDDVLEAAANRVKDGAGVVIVSVLSKQDAMKAAKAADKGADTVHVDEDETPDEEPAADEEPVAEGE